MIAVAAKICSRQSKNHDQLENQVVWNIQIPARAEGLSDRSGAGPEPGQSMVLSYIQKMIAECYHEDSQNIRASVFSIQGMWAHAHLQL